MNNIRQIVFRLLWILLLAALLYFALRNAPLIEIWSAIRQLQGWQIFALMGINVAIYALVTLRWWIIARAEARHVPYLPLLAVRVAVFGVSYFTLGPQVGGEPLQVLALRHRYGMTYTRATSTVLMDKLLEFLGNFVMLAFGMTGILEAGILSERGISPALSLTVLVILLAWPPIHISLMRGGKHPISAILRLFPRNKVSRFLMAAERMAVTFCQRHFRSLMAAILVSVLAATCMIGEYFLITSFLRVDISAWQTVAAWTAGWLAFIVPWPGGLGALEASQVFALGAFGMSAASAIGVTLLIRARDLLIGGLGLILAGRGVTK